MQQEIKTIRLPLRYHLGSVNCYLIATDTGNILIDTGGSNKRTDLEKELESAGCKPGNLKLIVVTHGDFDDGYNLSEFGFDATVLSIPGHSRGSIGILTAGGDPSVGSELALNEVKGLALFCGDLLDNTDKPVLNSIMDDSLAANASIEKLKSIAINTVYPGHGAPFPLELFIKNHR